MTTTTAVKLHDDEVVKLLIAAMRKFGSIQVNGRLKNGFKGWKEEFEPINNYSYEQIRIIMKNAVCTSP